MDTFRVISGSIASQNSKLPIDSLEEKLCSDYVTQRGLIFIGGARQGKTNVILKVCSDIFNQAKKGDLIVFFDVKGDYSRIFYEDGDLYLSPLENKYLWNIFEDFKGLPPGNLLEYRVKETIEYLFVGMESEREPFWTNSAKLILYCFIMYMLMDADIKGDTSTLNHYNLSLLIDGEMEKCRKRNDKDAKDCYDSYREILQSNINFRSVAAMLPKKEINAAMGYSIITEILAMRDKIFVGSFRGKKHMNDQVYISPCYLPSNKKGPAVLFLKYNERYHDVCAPIFRCFVDMLIASYLEGVGCRGGKLYLVLDELASLPELRRLGQALELGPQYGIRVIAGLQTVEQMRLNYSRTPNAANVILGGFQNTVAFKSDAETVNFLCERFGTALVQRVYTRAGGGIGYTEPSVVHSVEAYDLLTLSQGQAVVALEGEKPFILQFPLYKAEG